VQSVLPCSGRKVAKLLGFSRSSLRYKPKPMADKKQQMEAMIVKFSKDHRKRHAKCHWVALDCA